MREDRPHFTEKRDCAMPIKDYYKTLGVSEKATEQEIKTAFRKLAKEYHPDRNPGNKAAEARFKEISEANEALSNKDKRAKYDQMKTAQASGFDFSNYSGRQPGAGSAYQGNVDMSDIFEMFSGRKGKGASQGFGGVGDIFDMFINRGNRNPFGAEGYEDIEEEEASDVTVRIKIPFELAFKGGETIIKVPHHVACSKCDGSGNEPGYGAQPCPMCKGQGAIQFSQGGYIISKVCPRCSGRGQSAGRACSVCQGTGEEHETSKIRVKIPEGAYDGMKIRSKGHGNENPETKARGDLYVIFNIKAGGDYTRQGDDVIYEMQVSKQQAKEGASLEVPLPDSKIILKVPAGTKPGSLLKVKGRGAMNIKTRKRGDFYVKIGLA